MYSADSSDKYSIHLNFKSTFIWYVWIGYEMSPVDLAVTSPNATQGLILLVKGTSWHNYHIMENDQIAVMWFGLNSNVALLEGIV